jgi:hypothetical protein
VDPDPSTTVNEAACTQAVAVAGEDVTHDVPGTEVILDGGVSWTDACVDGVVEYRWRIGGVTIQEYSNNPILFAVPADTTMYTLDVRCSTRPACLGSDSVLVKLIDPGEVSGTPATLGTVRADPEALVGGRDDGRDARRRIRPRPRGRPRGRFPEDQVVRVDWAEAGEGAQVFVLGVKVRRRGVELRAGDSADPALRIREAACRLDEAIPAAEGRVEVIESDIALEPGEIFGYLAQARTGRPGFPARSGSLGQGESPGESLAFARGAGDPLSRYVCLP